MDIWSETTSDENNVVNNNNNNNNHHPLPPTLPITVPAVTFSKKNMTVRHLVQHMEAIVSSYELQEKYSTKLTPHSMVIIEQLIKTKPEFFRVVESTLMRNINDDKINANEVPYIISIISQLYNLVLLINNDFSQPNEIPADSCGIILKFIFSVAVRENMIQIRDYTDATLLLLCCDNIVDACVKLLKIQTPKPISVLMTPIPVHIPEPSTIIKHKQDGCCK